MRDNRGFSLIEIIVVLCIAALLVSGATVGIKSLHYADAQYCAKELNTALYALRTKTLGQGELHHYLVVEWDDTKQEYYLNFATSSGTILDNTNWKTEALSINKYKKLASKLITLSYSMDGSSFTDIRDAESVILISYKADSGAFESSYKQIRVTSDSKSSILYMVKSTGNHYIK